VAERDLLAGPDVELGDRAQVFAMDRGRSRQRQPVGAGDCGHPAIIESPHLRDDRAVLAADDAGQLMIWLIKIDGIASGSIPIYQI
jgi:hypothetical protein